MTLIPLDVALEALRINVSGQLETLDWGEVDERKRVPDTRVKPFQMICSIEHDVGGVFTPVGTGFLVGPSTVVTAAHVLFDAGAALDPPRVRVIPARDGDGAPPFGAFICARDKYMFHPAWKGAQKPETDCAAIHLPQRVGDIVGRFKVASFANARLEGRMINIAGYPADVGIPGQFAPERRQLWHHANQLSALQPKRIFYSTDTSPGQSGAPAYLWPDPGGEQGAHTVVGVHAYGSEESPDGRSNSATRISDEIAAMIQGWIVAHGG